MDRDLHMPLVTENSIPPQPLRPAPQPQTTPRPRPSLLHSSNHLDYIKMQEISALPLTPPPFLLNEAQRSAQPSAIFTFQSDQFERQNPIGAEDPYDVPRMNNFATRNAFANNQMNCSYFDQANTLNSEAR